MEKEIIISPDEIANTRKRLIELEKIVQSHDERLKSLEAREEIVSTPVKK